MRMRARILGVSLLVPLLLGATAAGAADGAAENQTFLDAVERADHETVRSLLDAGADVNITAGDGTSALIWAVSNDDLEMVELLLDAGSDISGTNEYGASALYVAATDANAPITEALLGAGADPNMGLLSGETPLMEAARRGKAETVRLLLAGGADPNASESLGGQTALMWAASERHANVAELLIADNADIKARSNGGSTPLMFAAQQGAAETANLLLAAGADVNGVMPGTALTPLLIASAMGRGNVVSVLLGEGADPNAIDGEGFTSLHYAASNKQALSMIEELLAHGADPNIRLRQERRTEFARSGVALEGATALLYAAEINSLDVVKALVEGGADPLIPTDQGTTALVLAAGGGTDLSRPRPRGERATVVETARFLVAHGADVNAAGQFGWAPIHAAAYQGLNDVISYLVAEGADPDQMDRFGQTALSISNAVITEGIGAAYYQAARVFRRDTADLLLALGATPLDESDVVQVMRRATD